MGEILRGGYCLSGKDHKVYAFDVDETLEVSGGPIKLDDLVALRVAGHILGLCGNFAAVTLQVLGWDRLFSFIGSGGMSKADFLRMIATYVPASEFVMVGNILGVRGGSDAKGAAEQAGWRFIKESDFAGGIR